MKPTTNNSSEPHRTPRACDNCRKRKSRCNGRQMPENKCTSCISANLPCLFTQTGRKRPPPPGYVEGLEKTIERMKELLISVKPDFDMSKDLDPSPDSPPPQPLTISAPASEFSKDIITKIIHSIGKRYPDDEDVDSACEEGAAHLVFPRGSQELVSHPLSQAVFGKSSGAYLARQIMALKDGETNMDKPLKSWRPEFWAASKWEYPPDSCPNNGQYPFPDDDLFNLLIRRYFDWIGYSFPVFHRPTLERRIAAKEHLTNRDFGALVMLMCCISARTIDDPRVLWDESSPRRSAGWRWFHQVQAIKKPSLLSPITLSELQYYFLCAFFASGSSIGHVSWICCGIGLRMAQFTGAHRRSSYESVPNIESEMWKRTVWALMGLDAWGSSALGRPCAFFQMDLDPPIEVDDEFMESDDPKLAFKQPPGRPSYVSFLNKMLNLLQILSFVLRTVYSIERLRSRLGATGPDWDQHLVTEIDSAMNKWFDSIPNHLRWNSNMKDEIFFDQSALLYTAFYFVQILIHRPFIPSTERPSRLQLPSLAICANAARACCNMVESYSNRRGTVHVMMQMPLFTAALVMLMNIWTKKRSGKPVNLQKEMVEVHKAIKMLKKAEFTWNSAGRFVDILQELATAGDLPLPDLNQTESAHSPFSTSSESSAPGRAEAPPASVLPSFPSPTQTTDFTGPESWDARTTAAWDSIFGTAALQNSGDLFGFPNNFVPQYEGLTTIANTFQDQTTALYGHGLESGMVTPSNGTFANDIPLGYPYDLSSLLQQQIPNFDGLWQNPREGLGNFAEWGSYLSQFDQGGWSGPGRATPRGSPHYL